MVKKWWPTLCWTFLIILMYFLPGALFPSTNEVKVPHLDKVIHFLAFFTYALVAMGNMMEKPSFTYNRFLALRVLLLLIAVGGILEFIQGTVIADRSSEFLDFVANASGALIGHVIFNLLWRSRHHRD